MVGEKKKEIGLSVLLLFLILSAVLIKRAGGDRHHERYEEMKRAAEQMAACEAVLKEERLRRGIPLAEEDFLQIGLLGFSSSSITTTVGIPEAKRTSMLPDMAAMCVRILDEAGLRSGDTIGACYSGSFPGLNLALICAADAMDIKIVYIASIGASSYGANLPGFTSPEMLNYLYEKGMISSKPAAVTLGGEGDEGLNMIGRLIDEDSEEFEQAVSRLRAAGLSPRISESYEENIQWRMDLYGDIDGFVNVGGNVAGMGRDEKAYALGQGVVADSGRELNGDSGLLERYLRKGVPAVQLLNLKQLCLKYGLEYDPSAVAEIGAGGVYYVRSYSRATIAVSGTLFLAGLLVLFRKKKAETVR